MKKPKQNKSRPSTLANSKPRVAIAGAQCVDGDALSPVEYKGGEGVETDRNKAVMVSSVNTVAVVSLFVISFEAQYLQKNQAHRRVGDNERFRSVVSM